MRFKFLLILLLVSFFQGCKSVTNEITKVIENNSPTQITDDDSDGNVVTDDEGVFEETGIEFTNPTSPIEVPKPKDKLDSDIGNPSLPQSPDGGNSDGIEFSNPELPSKSQKGPFYMDSDIFIQEIAIDNNQFELTGEIFIDRVTDNLGSFNLPRRIASPYLEIRVNGYYFNEITGEPSDGTISLGSYSSLKDGQAPNINILTTLAQKRIRYLVEEENLEFEDAENRAKLDVLRSFNIEEEINNFDELRMDRDSVGSAVLLAISVILQGDLSTVELSNFIAIIREDLKENGRIDNENILDQICYQSRTLNPFQIRLNLQSFYESLDLAEYEIPLFEDYLDSDCDGILNKDDPESFIFLKRKKPNFLKSNSDFTIYPFNNRLWIMGGLLFNIYYSSDIENWEEINYRGSDFQLTRNPLMIEYRNKLYIFGGKLFHSFIDNETGLIYDLDVLSAYKIDTSYTVETIIRNEFNKYGYSYLGNHNNQIQIDRIRQSYIYENYPAGYFENYFNDTDRDNIFPNYSSTNHSVKVLKDKIYVVSKGLNANDRNAGFKGARLTQDGINWETDGFCIILDMLPNDGTFDIAEYNDQIYVSGIGENPYNPFLGFLSTVSRFLFDRIHFTNYENILVNYNLDQRNYTVLDQEEEHELLVPGDYQPIHKPFVFKNMVHHIVEEDYILFFGYYKNYKSYIGINNEADRNRDILSDIEMIENSNIGSSYPEVLDPIFD